MLAVTMRPTRRAALALCTMSVLVGSALLPAVATAELGTGGGISELANKAEQEEATATTAAASGKQETEPGSSSIPSALLIAAVAAGALLLGGIAFVILRDARSVAPVAEGSASGGSRNPEARLRRRRAQAKAAKRQRKRNR
jgi:hypothetical protein